MGMTGVKNGLNCEDTRTRFCLKLKGAMTSIETYKERTMTIYFPYKNDKSLTSKERVCETEKSLKKKSHLSFNDNIEE